SSVSSSNSYGSDAKGSYASAPGFAFLSLARLFVFLALHCSFPDGKESQSGIGKSTLINRVFGIDEARAEHNQRGVANIETELTSHQNPRLVLHDSRGFESGDRENSETVERFITRRKTHPDIGERLHAIWLCFEAPLDDHGERLIEKGMGAFLERKQDIIGDIPVIFIFTKFDKIIDHFEQKRFGQISFLMQRSAKRHLQQYCLSPIAKVVKDNKFKYVAVTIRSGYETEDERLVQFTCQMVSNTFGLGIEVLTSMAQRTSTEVKIKAESRVRLFCWIYDLPRGETDFMKAYWNTLVSSAEFFGRSIAECLLVIHTDIVRVWNFYDPEAVRGIIISI
ncbi:hypothetical protein ID866_8603, partial [Astraeus odoratus]